MEVIRGMTNGQKNRVRDITVPLARQWCREQGATEGRVEFVGAYADLDAQQYIGMLQLVFSRGEARYFGKLGYRLNPGWQLAGQPTIELHKRGAT